MYSEYCIYSKSNEWGTTVDWNLPFLTVILHRGLRNGIMLPKLFWPTVKKNDQEKNLKFEAEGGKFEIFLGSLEQFIQTVKGQNNFR